MNLKTYFNTENKLSRRIEKLSKRKTKQKWIVAVDIKEYKSGKRYEVLFYHEKDIEFIHIKVDKYGVALFDHNISEKDAKKIQRLMYNLFFGNN